MGTNDVLGSFNHLLLSPTALDCAQTMPICNGFSQYAFYSFASVKIVENLASELCHLKFSLRSTDLSELS